MLPSSTSGAKRARVIITLACALVASQGCDGEFPSSDEVAELANLRLEAGVLPASPTNRFADQPEAAELGRALFFDRRMSADGTIGCVNCHDPARGFSDPHIVSTGVRGQTGKRHAMPITSAALQPFLLWDGRAGSVWRQPLFALENEREMDFTRVEVAHFIAENYSAAYEATFGPPPDLLDVPARGRPGDAAWDALSDEQRDGVQRVFVNVGKAIEAYERKLACADTRFDRWVSGDLTLSDDELEGAAQFLRSGCTKCHNGPAVSDGKFHNLGLSRADASAIDTGREAGIAVLLDDDLNGASAYSDDPAAGGARLAAASIEQATRGAFRTASLRGVAQRARFGHLGQQTNLEEFIEDTYNRGRGGRDDDRGDRDDDRAGADIVGALDPLLDDVHADRGDAERIAAFLRTMNCPDAPASLLKP